MPKDAAKRIGNFATLEKLFGSFNAGVFLFDQVGELAYLNSSAERIFAVSWNAARKNSFEKIFRHSPELIQAIHEVRNTRRSLVIHELGYDARNLSGLLEVEICPVGEEEAPEGLLLWINEVSTLKALQEEKRREDRLAMMGTLASGLAHEIRNPLGGIRAAAEMLARAAAGEDLEYLDIILTEVDRLSRLIGELLNFTKPKTLDMVPLNLNRVLSEILTLHQPWFQSQNIQLKEEFDPSLPETFGNEDALKQALLNLVKNAVEAMPSGGQLHIASRFHSHLPLFFSEGPAGPIAEISVRDTGVGISEESMQALFTPFFTTKSAGTGLGLMMTQRIIKEHQGQLKVQSEPGRGSVFRVFLKLASLKAKD